MSVSHRGYEMSQKQYAVKLTKSEIYHIWACLDDREREGCYYGPRQQFWDRHARIIVKLAWPLVEDGVEIRA